MREERKSLMKDTIKRLRELEAKATGEPCESRARHKKRATQINGSPVIIL